VPEKKKVNSPKEGRSITPGYLAYRKKGKIRLPLCTTTAFQRPFAKKGEDRRRRRGRESRTSNKDRISRNRWKGVFFLGKKEGRACLKRTSFFKVSPTGWEGVAGGGSGQEEDGRKTVRGVSHLQNSEELCWGKKCVSDERGAKVNI